MDRVGVGVDGSVWPGFVTTSVFDEFGNSAESEKAPELGWLEVAAGAGTGAWVDDCVEVSTPGTSKLGFVELLPDPVCIVVVEIGWVMLSTAEVVLPPGGLSTVEDGSMSELGGWAGWLEIEVGGKVEGDGKNEVGDKLGDEKEVRDTGPGVGPLVGIPEVLPVKVTIVDCDGANNPCVVPETELEAPTAAVEPRSEPIVVGCVDVVSDVGVPPEDAAGIDGGVPWPEEFWLVEESVVETTDWVPL